MENITQRLVLYKKQFWGYNKDFPYIYRYDPVPYVHKYKKGRTWRHPKTTQELRFNCLDKEYVRRKRNNVLPDAWDDLWIRRQKNWKSQMKTRHQWER